MRRTLVFCALVVCTLGKPEGYFHQQMQYSRKAESYRDNELERSEGDDAFYSKHGDLEGRTQPKVDSHSSHTEYENPRFKNQGTSGSLMYGQGSNAGYGYNNRDYLSRGGYGANYQQNMGLNSGGYRDSSNFDSMSSSSSHSRQFAGSRGFAATGGGYTAGNHGAYTIVPAASSQLQEMSRRLHEQMSQQLQSAIRKEHQMHSAAFSSSSSSSSFNNNYDFHILEDEIRRNLTRQFQEALSNQYRSPTSSIPYPFTSSGGIRQEFEDLRAHVEQDLLRELREGVQTQHVYRPVAVPTKPVLEYRAPAPAYNTKGSSWDSSAGSQTQYQSQYQPTVTTVTFVPLTEVTSRVEDTVARNLQSALLEVDRQFNEQSSQVYSSNSGLNVDYSGQLNELTDQLVRNLTETLENELRRNYGRYEERDSYVYVDSRPVFRTNELEEKKQQIRNELIRKLENSYRQKYNNYVQRASYVRQQQQDQTQTHQSYQPEVRPQPLSTGGYSSSSSASHSASASYNGGYSQSDYPEGLNVVANEVQTDLSRQLQSALIEQEKQLRHMMSYGQQDRPNYQQTLAELQDELKRNFTDKLDDSLRRHYRVETQSGSYFFATGGGSGSQNQQQMQQKLERLRDSLQSQLMQQLERGMAHQQSYYSSASSSSSASSGYKSAQMTQYPSSSYSQNYGSGLSYQEDCDTQGDDPQAYRRSVRSTPDQQQEDVEDLVQQSELLQQKDLDKLTQQPESPEVSGKLQTSRGDINTNDSQQREREEVSSNLPSRPPKRTYPAKQRIHARPAYSFNEPSTQGEDLTQQRQEETADLTQQVQQPESNAPFRNYPSSYTPRPYTSNPLEDSDLTQQKAQAEDLSQIRDLTQQQEQTEDLAQQQQHETGVPSRGFTWSSNPSYRPRDQVSGLSQQQEQADLTQQQQRPTNEPIYVNYLRNNSNQPVTRPTFSWQYEDVTPQRGAITPTRNYPLSESSYFKPTYTRPNRYNDQVTNPTIQSGQVDDLTQQQQREPIYVNYQPGFQPTSGIPQGQVDDLTQKQQREPIYVTYQPGFQPTSGIPQGQVDDLTQKQQREPIYVNYQPGFQPTSGDLIRQPSPTVGYRPTGVSRPTYNNYDAQVEDLTQQQEQVEDLTQQRQTQDQYFRQPIRGSSYRTTTTTPRTSYFNSQDLSNQQTTDLGLQSRDLTQQQEFDELTNTNKPVQAKPLSVIGLDEQKAENEDGFGKLEIGGSHINRNWRHHDKKPVDEGQQQEQLEDLLQLRQKPTGSSWDDTQRTEDQNNFGKLEIGSQYNRNRRPYNRKPSDLDQQQEQVEDLTQVQQKPTVSGSFWDDSQRTEDQNFGKLETGSQYNRNRRPYTRKPSDLDQQQEQVEDLTQVQQKPTVSGSFWDDSQRTEDQNNFGKLETGSQYNRNRRPYNQKPTDLDQQQEQVEDLTQVQQKPTVSGSLWGHNQRTDDQNNFGSLQTGSQTRPNTRSVDSTQQQEQVEDLTQVQQKPTVSGSLRDDNQFYQNERQYNFGHNSDSSSYSTGSRSVYRPRYTVGQGAQYELETEHVGAPRTTPKVNYANQGQLEDNFGRADEFYSLTTEKQRAVVVDDTSNDRRTYGGVKGGRGRAGSPFNGQMVDGQYQVEPTISPTADVEQFEVPTETENPGFWKRVGSKLENTYNQAKAATAKLAKNIRTSVGY